MGASAQEAIRVVAEPLVGIKQNVTAKAPAQVISSNEAAIAAEVDAVVASVNVEVSDTVKKGTVLVELDSRDLELQLAQAEANLAAQQARIQRGEVRLKRARELAKSQFVSEDELLERETDLEVLLADRRVVQVSVASAKRELNKTRVLAPFDGVILTRDAQVGAFANRSTPLLTLVEIGRPRLLAQISNGDVESVRRGFNLAFQNESGHWPVQLKEIAQVVNNRTRVQSARFDFIGEQPLAGSTGYLVWDRPENVVSTTMIVRRDNRLGVFTLENGKAVFHHLPGAQEGRPAAVNLPDDTLIIVRGQQRVQDGDAAVNAR
ncbi:MAG: efflux RND transporter periplasmic adaptor subunit [Pseudomonadota bacterium]